MSDEPRSDAHGGDEPVSEGMPELPAERLGAVRQLRRVGLWNLLPIKLWLRDRPWNLDVVRWFLFFTLFPLFMVSWAALTRPNFPDVALIFGVYFATISAVVLYFFIRPEHISITDIVRVALFTAVAGIFAASVLQQLPGLRSLYGAARGGMNVGVRLIGYVLGVGVVEETAKALPILWIFVHRREPGSAREITFLGCISGFAFGVSESATYSISYALNLGRGALPFEEYIVVQFTRLITLPLLHATFAGISAHFIALGVRHPGARRGLILAGLGIAALLHGVYNTFAATILGFIGAAFSVLLFIAYIRSVDTMDRAIGEAADRD